MDKKQQVGFIGLGAMGSLMATHLLSNGIEVHVYDIQSTLCNEIAEKGGIVHPHPKSVAEHSMVIICMLPNPSVVRSVILGENGVLEGVKRESVVIDMGTVGPSVEIECAERLQEKGAHLIDAPVGKGVWAAGSGELTILAGGDKEIIARVEDILNMLGEKIIYCGPLGSGQVVKLSNNLASCVNMAALSELYVLAQKNGIDIDVIQEALTGTAADSWHLHNSLPRVKQDEFSPGFKTKLAHKDLELVVGLGEELGIDLPVSSNALSWYNNAMDKGYEDSDWSALAKAALEKVESKSVK